MSGERLQIVPASFAEANEFVRRFHRHRGKVRGFKFAIGCAAGEKVVGVAIVGRPIARQNQDGFTLEVTRLATDGTKNAGSMLYAACWRAAREQGYRRVGTYNLKTESGASLHAAGYRIVGEVKAQSWHRNTRPRVDTHPLQDKLRWEVGA